MGFHPIRVRYRHENSSAACASHKQENAPGGNRTKHSVIHIQSLHLGPRNTNRGPGPSFRPSPSHYWHRDNVFSGGDILVLALKGDNALMSLPAALITGPFGSANVAETVARGVLPHRQSQPRHSVKYLITQTFRARPFEVAEPPLERYVGHVPLRHAFSARVIPNKRMTLTEAKHQMSPYGAFRSYSRCVSQCDGRTIGDPLPVTEYGTTNDHRTDRSYLERAAKKNVDSKRDENGNCRCSDGCRQLRGSAFPQEQSDSGHNVSKARHEVEPKHEGNGSRQVRFASCDFCVRYSAEDARREGFEAIVIEDACRGIDIDGSMATARELFRALGIRCISKNTIEAGPVPTWGHLLI